MYKSIMNLLATAAICLIISCDLAAAEENALPTVRPYLTLTGANSRIKERGCYRIASDAEWIKIWQRHNGAKEAQDYDLFYNPLGLPEIDFEKCMVIAVFQGSIWNNAGLKAVEVLEKKDEIILRFDNKYYQTMGPDGGGQEAAVYGFFVLPRSNKTVVLEEKVPNLRNEPPVWKAFGTMKPSDAEDSTGKTGGTKTAFKGWELYVWQESGKTYFSLMPGTNRMKPEEEIHKAAVKDIDAIKAKLDELKPGEDVFVMGRERSEIPPENQVESIIDYGRKIGYKMHPPAGSTGQ